MIIAQLCLAGIAFAAPPRLSPALVTQTRAAAEHVLAGGPLATKAQIRAMESAMARVHRGLNAYFHAPNLLDARTEALALRVVFRSLRQGARPAMLLVGDVLRFNAALHTQLAQACEAVKDRGCALRHRLAALASGPATPAQIEATRRLLPPKDRAVFDRRQPQSAPVSPGSSAPASRPE